MSECSNCGSSTWAAKNDTYCTDCASDWYNVFAMTVSSTPNPLQAVADDILNDYKDSGINSQN